MIALTDEESCPICGLWTHDHERCERYRKAEDNEKKIEAIRAAMKEWREEQAYLAGDNDTREDRLVGLTYKACADTVEKILEEGNG